jgi:uncharacterized protein YfaP (DUF2135 family)
VVVKVPHPDLLADEKFRIRFAREVRNLVDLADPHIVKVSDAGTHEGTPYVVLEHLEGGSLKDRLTEGPLPPDRVLDWLPDIAKALDHIHDEGVIHRDVKPGNLLFDHQENAFLSDFGISKALHDSASGLTVTGVSPGSPGYIPPEALGLEIDGAYDQYSLASVVFRCATGRRLQPHDPYLGVWNELASHLPSAAASAVEKALSVNPADRFRTCWEFAEAFASGIRGTPAPKEEPSTRTLVETPPPETPNKPKGMTLLFVSVVLLILVFAGYAYLKVRPGTEVEPSTVARDPIVELASPSPGGVTNRSSVEIRGRLRDAPGGHLLVKGRRLNPDEDGMFLALITLEKGANDIEVIGITAEGVRTESRSVDVFYDPDDPQVVLDSPGSGLVTTESRVELRGRLDDAQPYPGKALVGDREIAVEPDGSFRADLELEEGEQTVRVRGVDRVGNIGPAVAVVVVKDSIDPVLELEAPADGSFTKLATGTVRGRVDDPNLARVEVNGEAVERLSDGCFEVPVDLVEGSNEIRVRAVDAAGNEAQATRTVTRDETPPAISSLFPEDGHRTDDATVTVRGVLAEERLDRLTVAGQVVKPGDGGAFEVTVPLDVGPNRIAVSAVDRAGNRTEREIGVTRGRPPLEVIVVRPADGLVTNETAIEVEVRLEGAAVAGRVRVNGRDLPADDDGIFRGTVEIADGPNELAIAAEDPPTGRSDSARLEVVRDTASPAVRVGSLRLAAAGDLLVVTGGLSEPGCRLSAAGHDAEVDGEEFTVRVPLEPGPNRVKLQVLDAAGNLGSEELTIHAGPHDLATEAGTELRLLDGCFLEELEPEDGLERFRPVGGVMQGVLAERTRIVLAAGRLRAPPGGQTRVYVEQSDGRSKIRCNGGNAFLNHGDWLLVYLKATQGIEVWTGTGRSRNLHFATPAGGTAVKAHVLVSKTLQIQLEIPGATNGRVQETDSGTRTLVASDRSSAPGTEIGVSEIRSGRPTALPGVIPGETRKLAGR